MTTILVRPWYWIPTMIYREFENLTIEGSADYQKAVYDLLEKLWGTWSGWAVIRAVVDTRKKVKIVPLLDSEVPREFGQRRAFAKPKNFRDASVRSAELYRGGVHDPGGSF
jgi:hypothetical protein